MPSAWTSRDERLEAARELAPVDDPVAQRRVVLVAPPEPAIVEHEQLDAEVLRLARDPDDPLVVEVEVGRLPVVEHDRTLAVAPRAARHPLPVQAVEGLGQAAEALAGPRDDGLRRGERRARLEAPGEGLRVDADAQARGPERVDLRLGQEVAGVDEAQAVGLAGVLGRRRAAQGEERAVLGAAHAAQAADGLAAVDEGPVVDVPLPGPRPAEGHEVPVGVGEVEDGRHRAPDDERRRAAVDERERARDDRAIREQRRPHGDPQAGRRVDEVDLERLGLVVRLGVGRREVGQVRLAARVIRWSAYRRSSTVEPSGPSTISAGTRKSPTPGTGTSSPTGSPTRFV